MADDKEIEDSRQNEGDDSQHNGTEEDDDDDESFDDPEGFADDITEEGKSSL